MIDLIIHSASQLLTISGPSPRRGISQGNLEIVEDGAVAVSGGQIVGVGRTAQILRGAGRDTRVIDAHGCVVLPGFVDAHTHLVFAGDRAGEFELRLSGASYLEIMRRGGGIMSTVRATRAASRAELVKQSRLRLARMITHGTTTAEVKTGYGLETCAELKLLDVIGDLAGEQPVELVPTFLGAHAVPEEFHGREDAYLELVTDEMLPSVKDKWQARMGPMFCDVFCDEGAFNLAQSLAVLTKAKELRFPLKIHADEFANLGASSLAAELGAVSADHLMVTRRDQMKQLAHANVVAVLLPGTTFGLGKFDFADGRAFVEENVPVALGTDLNPGTSWCESMPMMIAVATRYGKLSPAEAIVAATLNAACAVGRGAYAGSLEPGKLADILISDVRDYRDLAYHYGTNPIRAVFKRGQLVSGSA